MFIFTSSLVCIWTSSIYKNQRRRTLKSFCDEKQEVTVESDWPGVADISADSEAAGR